MQCIKIDCCYKYSKISAFLAGLLLTLAFAPFNCFVAAILAVYVLVNLLYASRAIITSFAVGYWFGFGFFLSSLYWISISLMVDISSFWWVFPFAVVGIPSVLAIYIGLLGVATTSFCHSKTLFVISFSVFWVAIEVLRGFVPFDFPWQFIGYTIAHYDYVLWITKYLGITLTSVAVMLFFTAFASENKLYIALVLLCASAIYANGHNNLEKAQLAHYSPKIRIVQPSTTDFHFGDSRKRADALSRIIALSSENLSQDIAAVIWPEAALPYSYSGNDYAFAKVTRFLPNGASLITGIDRLDANGQIFNSIIAFDSSGHVQKIYDKETLVPFGEYIPFRAVLGFFPKITDGILDFSPGLNIAQTNDKFTLDFYPLICYEALFPFNNNSRDYKWVLNVTNDAWFGNSIGPHQHFAMVKFKAAEYARPIVRVANNGISGVIDEKGRVQEILNWNEVGYRDIQIPYIKHSKDTWSLIKVQNLVLLLMVLILISVNMGAVERKPEENDTKI